jgi:hypothetical protein
MTEMPKEVLDALAHVLQEFGDCDLEERLQAFEQDYADGADDARRRGDELAWAWSCVVDWMAAQGRFGLNMQCRDVDIAALLADPKHPDWKKMRGAYRAAKRAEAEARRNDDGESCAMEGEAR